MFEKQDLERIAQIVAASVEPMRQDIEELRESFKETRQEIKAIQMILEQETNKKLQIIAEGHLDLNRKLDESLRVNQEKEMLLLRVANLEHEVRQLKEESGPRAAGRPFLRAVAAKKREKQAQRAKNTLTPACPHGIIYYCKPHKLGSFKVFSYCPRWRDWIEEEK